MSRSHKERHAWKRKERRRTGKADPAKIKKHRKRHLAKIAPRDYSLGQYQPVIFSAKLVFNPAEMTTEIWVDGELLETVTFPLEDPGFCHHKIAQIRHFDPDKEQEALRAHTAKAKALKEPCRLNLDGTCACILSCKFRKWQPDLGLPLCDL